MTASERVRRHGYHLMSLASIGMLVCTVVWIAVLGASWTLQTGKPAGADPGNSEFWLTLALACIALLGKLWALYRLRIIGKLLHAGSFINAQMTRAWRWLGHALVVAGVLALVTLDPNVDMNVSTGHFDVTAGIDLDQAYFIVLLCLISYSIAWILEEALALKDDNQGIV